ncbi:MAG: Phosphoadenosine phosphosulfate reductase [Nitrospirae bacterium]|mgnify:CR=1 FL=1|nr:MAG: phosphoadenosine phosphosulfate reductase [Nitrospira sp. OLB3]MBV6469998.1 Phosphoadenosine phosphosulfate reductase [Nitrospirota bacterium]MCK6493787.1 phosphoadenylyl-sulfate reductase [Nitrospira sp.]MEB2338309.1 phosphoadenylyl-sulfate reductase [Nitrospirales bacterium]
MAEPGQTAVGPSDADLKSLSDSFEGKQPWEVLEYALKAYAGRIVLACSFGAEDVALVDMVHRIDPQAPLFYLDTDFLFPETLEVRDRIIDRYGLQPTQVIRMTSLLTPDQQAAQHGAALWAGNPDHCCQLRKIEPLTRVLGNYAAWITGIRRDQAPTRANAGMIEWDKKFGLVKINPLAAWTSDQVWMYIRLHEVPYNTLHDRNYPSIGCTHCTAPVLPGDDPRSGRWKNFGKTECGLHK